MNEEKTYIGKDDEWRTDSKGEKMDIMSGD